MLVRFCLAMFLMLPLAAAAQTQVNVVGLFSGKAVLIINGGQPRTLAAGQTSPEGVKLIESDSTRAVLEIEGKRRTLAMGQGAAVAGGASSSSQTAILYANQAGHFFAEGRINGRPATLLVDTGASHVAMSSELARKIGLDYQSGEAGVAQTAGGAVRAYRVILNNVKIGNITLYQVEGSVIEGVSPPFVLLGMSALNRIDMKRDGIALTLTKKY